MQNPFHMCEKQFMGLWLLFKKNAKKSRELPLFSSNILVPIFVVCVISEVAHCSVSNCQGPNVAKIKSQVS